MPPRRQPLNDGDARRDADIAQLGRNVETLAAALESVSQLQLRFLDGATRLSHPTVIGATTFFSPMMNLTLFQMSTHSLLLSVATLAAGSWGSSLISQNFAAPSILRIFLTGLMLWMNY